MTKNVCVAKSPLGYNVCVTEDTWKDHITQGHKIMENNADAIMNAIEDPIAIYGSLEWPNRDVYFGKSEIATYKSSLYTKVIIETPDQYNEYGTVVSAWPQKNIDGNINEKELKHVKPKLR